MTTRALEDHEIKAIFEHIEGVHAKRNETLLFVGIGMALRVSELVGLTTTKIVEYAERLSDHLFSVIQGDRVDKFNSSCKMLNLQLKDVETSEMILELQLRGVDVSSIIEQLQEKRVKKEAKVIQFPMRG